MYTWGVYERTVTVVQLLFFTLQCLGCVSRQAGHRVGPYLEHVIPSIMNFCDVDDDELKEYCIQAFESFILKSPKEITPYVPQVCTCLVSVIAVYIIAGTLILIASYLKKKTRLFILVL